MIGQGNAFAQNYSNSDNPETSFSEERINPETVKHLYQVPFELVDHFRRHTRSYTRKIGGLQTITELPTRGASKITPTCTKDSVLVVNFKELVSLSLQEIDQLLNQLGP